MFFFFCGPPPSPFSLSPSSTTTFNSFVYSFRNVVFLLRCFIFFPYELYMLAVRSALCASRFGFGVVGVYGIYVYVSLCVCARVLLAGLVIFFFRVLLLDFVGLYPSSLFGCIAFLFFCVVFRSRVQTEPTRTRARASGVQHRRHRGSCPCRSAWSSRQCCFLLSLFLLFCSWRFSPDETTTENAQALITQAQKKDGIAQGGTRIGKKQTKTPS